MFDGLKMCRPLRRMRYFGNNEIRVTKMKR